MYLIDIIILPQTEDEHIEHNRSELSFFYRASVTLSLKTKEMQALQKEKGHLGDVVRPDGLKHDSHTTDTIYDL